MTAPRRREGEYVADVYRDVRARKWRAVIYDECGSTTIVSHRTLDGLCTFLDSRHIGQRIHRPACPQTKGCLT